MALTIFILLALIKNVCLQICQNGRVISSTIPEEEKQNVVRVHNLYRACVALGYESQPCQDVEATYQTQPQGANIQELFWDDELAKTAQRWANTCLFQHDSIADRNDSRFPIGVGQNLAIHTISDDSTGMLPDFLAVIKGWFDEESNFNFHPLTESDFELQGYDQIGHYTQVVWHNTIKIGCGYLYYEGSNKWFNKFYVCNYGPSGNIIEETPYEIGKSNCSAFKLKAASTPGLCMSHD